MTTTLNAKLHPRNFKVSGKWAAILGYILQERFTDPAIDDMCITSDGGVLAQHEGDLGMNDFIGDVSDLERNWANYLDHAKLTDAEKIEANAQFKHMITDWRESA